MNRDEQIAYAAAAVAGLGVWVGLSWATGEIEAWDSQYYFVGGLPALAMVSFALGYLVPQRPWRWPLTIAAVQVVAMFLLHPGVGPLLPVGLMLHAVIAVGLLLAAFLGCSISKWRHHGRTG